MQGRKQYVVIAHSGVKSRGRGGFARESGRPPICYNYGEPGHVQMYYTKPRKLCGYCHNTKHLTEDCPELIAKLEEKRRPNIHMIIVIPHDRPIDPANVRVIILGGACMG